MGAVDLEALPAWLEGRRWFGGKGAAIASVRQLDEAQLSDALTVVTVEVAYQHGRAPEAYLLPLKPSLSGALDEALVDERAARALLDVIRGRMTIPTAHGTLQGERFDERGSPLDALALVPSVRRLAAEQSNTSIVFGEAVILKLIRKVERGVSPELELGAHLARRGFEATPQLLGALSLHGAVEGTVAVLHKFVNVESDGWSYVLKRLRERGAPSPELLADVRDLGRSVGELHLALADAQGDPAFAPEPITREFLDRLRMGLLGDLERTIALVGPSAPGLAERRNDLVQRIQGSGNAIPSGVRIRQHGDLHLGQTLRSGGGWLIFDFEGEPARPMAERREKHAPFKDVAGMLRSFAYALGTVELESREPDGAQLRKAFLQAYRDAAARLFPDQDGTAHALLELYELEKLLYEVRYEVGHRPDWVRIPLRDLLSEAR